MKHFAIALLAALALSAGSGCQSMGQAKHCNGCYEGCDSCGGGKKALLGHASGGCQSCKHGHGKLGHGHGGRSDGGPDVVGPYAGPPVGTVTYPYYTTRGPRDFLLNNPPSIGP